MSRMVVVVLFILFLTTPALAMEPPGEFDWSVDKIMFTTSARTKLPMISGDAQGKFHLLWHDEDGVLYKGVDPKGNVLIESRPELPVGDDVVINGFPTDQGYNIVWAQLEGEYYELYIAVLDTEGKIIETTPLQYDFPEIGEPGLKRLSRIEADVCSSGIVHVLLTGAVNFDCGFLYARYHPDFQLESIRNVPDFGRGGVSVMYPGQMAIDQEDNVYIVTSIRGRLELHKYCPLGNKIFSEELGEAVFTIPGLAGNDNQYYAMRGVPPTLAVDENGVCHLAWTHLSHSGFGDFVDVKYARFENGSLETKVLTCGRGQYQFPSLTLDGDLVLITWEQSMRSNRNLFFSALNTQGEVLYSDVRLDWNNALSWLGRVYADGDELTAFWWGSGPWGTRMVMKSTHNPMDINMWRLAGLNPQDPENALASQILYYGVLTLFTSVGGVIMNLHNLLIVMACLFLLHKLQLLEPLLERPWQLLAICLTALFMLVSPVESPIGFPLGLGYHVWSSLIASIALGLVIYLFKLKIYNTLNLLFISTLWLWLLMLIQYIPLVPHQVI